MTTATIYIERNGVDDIPVLVTGTYHRGYKGTREQPPEQAYVELESAVIMNDVKGDVNDFMAMFKQGEDIELTATETERAEEALYEASMDDMESDREAAAEARARRSED